MAIPSQDDEPAPRRVQAMRKREPSQQIHELVSQLRAQGRKKEAELRKMRAAMAELREEMEALAPLHALGIYKLRATSYTWRVSRAKLQATTCVSFVNKLQGSSRRSPAAANCNLQLLTCGL